jgi:hypothetical protein
MKLSIDPISYIVVDLLRKACHKSAALVNQLGDKLSDFLNHDDRYE